MRGRTTVAALAVLFAVAALALSSCGYGAPGDSGGEGGDAASQGPRNEFSFLVCGDPHARTDLLQRIVAQARTGEFLVVVGDIGTGKGLEEMRGMKDFLDSSGLEYHVIPGDNDMPGGDPSVFKAVFGADHYSLERQDAHLVFLNDAVVGTGCPEEVLAWLRSDLAGVEEGKLVIGFAHVPPGAPVDMAKTGFVKGETDSCREMRDILAEAGAPVIYCGHIHVYMLYSSGPPRVVVSGGAGANLHLSKESGGFNHFLRVTVRGGEVTEEVVRL